MEVIARKAAATELEEGGEVRGGEGRVDHPAPGLRAEREREKERHTPVRCPSPLPRDR